SQLFGGLSSPVLTYGLRCYSCTYSSELKSCNNIVNCGFLFNWCATMKISGVTTKSCQIKALCVGPMKCCKGDLCNSAVPTGSSLLLLLVSSAFTSLFL
uniref:UPAR/Ly6 domain-containing protein n=1 Tax=Mola mola TaxID=94237 RepID=A0A3Q3X4W0_MOLML